MSTANPKRLAELQIDLMPDGSVVYDPKNDRVHYLNPSSALIFELCDGENGLQHIAETVQSTFDLAQAPIDAVKSCIENLLKEGLLES